MKTSSQPNDPEFAATERAYGGAKGYAQALAAGRTKLNYQQWIQVRTPAFKERFGDWEKAALQTLLVGQAVANVHSDEVPQTGLADVRQWATRILDQQGGSAENPEVGNVVLDEHSVRSSLGHGKPNRFKYAAFAAVKDVLEHGSVVHRATRERTDSFYISAPVKIDSVDDVVTVLVHRDYNTQRMYLHSVATKESLLRRRGSSVDATKASERSGSSSAGEVSKILHDALNFNGVVSKAIDPATGEPLVLYRADSRSLRVAADLEKEKAQDSYGRPDHSEDGSSIAPIAGLGKFVHHPPRRVNPDSMFKTIDRDTGEPWVPDGAQFRQELFFTKNPPTPGDMSPPVFLNARALDGETDHIHDGNAWLVLDPAQILSAAGNSYPLDRDDPTTVKANLSAGDQPMANPIQNESTVYGEPKPAAPNDHVDRDTLPDLTQEDAFLANELLVDESPLQAIASSSPGNERDQAKRDSEKPSLSPTARKRAKKATSDAQPSPAPKEEKPKRARSTKAKDKAASTPEPAAPQPAPSPAPAPKGVAALDPHAQQRLDRVATNRAADLADAKKKLDADAMNRARIHLLQDPIGRHIVAVDLGGVTKAYSVDENPGIAAKTVNSLREGMRKLGSLANEIGYLPDVIKTRFRLKSGEEKIAYNVDPEGVDPRHPHMREAGLGENDRRNLVVIPDGNPDEISKKVLLSTDLPDDVKKRFVYSDTVPGQYFDRSRKLAFIDKGGRLATDQNTPEIIASMVSVAQAKGWKAITIKGHEDFQREAWLAASLAGIEVKGFKPKEPDLARLEYERQVRMGNAIQATAPTPTPVANEISGAAPGKQSPELSPEAVALGEVARLKGVREDQIPNFVKAAQDFIDQAKRDGIDLPALKIFDSKAPATPTVTTPEKTRAPREPRSIDAPHPDKAPKR